MATPELADRLHSAAIHLLRRARRTDPLTGVSAAQLSALSVLMSGPKTLGELAAAEQVRAPTMSRLVSEMERTGAARKVVDEFEIPAAVIVKHNNPCGCAVGGSALEAFERALATDPVSAFGGVYCFNRPVNRELAEKLNARRSSAR